MFKTFIPKLNKEKSLSHNFRESVCIENLKNRGAAHVDKQSVVSLIERMVENGKH